MQPAGGMVVRSSPGVGGLRHHLMTPSLRRSRRAIAVVVALLATLAAACSDDTKPFSESADSTAPTVVDTVPPEFVVLPTDFKPIDTRGVTLQPVPNDLPPEEENTEPIPVTDPSGKATLKGVVTYDGKGVGGARVVVERFVGNRRGTIELTANDSGAFSVTNALGGRYRIRAWETPNLTAYPSTTVFLPAEAEIDIPVPLSRFEGHRLQAALDQAVPHVGEEVYLKALLTAQEVDGAGRITGDRMAGEAITLTLGPGYRLTSTNPAKTGPDGIALWTIRCNAPGAWDLTVEWGTLSTVITLPDCVDGPFSGGPGDGSSTSSTSSIPGESTTTTAPDNFPVGEQFTPPRARPLPPGTYASVEGGPCDLEFREREDGTWTPRSVSGTQFTSELVFADIKVPAGGTSCTWTRTQ
jgi:hypothetical protein